MERDADVFVRDVSYVKLWVGVYLISMCVTSGLSKRCHALTRKKGYSWNIFSNSSNVVALERRCSFEEKDFFAADREEATDCVLAWLLLIAGSFNGLSL